MSAYDRARYARRKAAGVCPPCGKPREDANRATCRACRKVGMANKTKSKGRVGANYTPTPEDIADAAKKVRAGWDAKTEMSRRAVQPTEEVTAPLLRTVEVNGVLVGLEPSE